MATSSASPTDATSDTRARSDTEGAGIVPLLAESVAVDRECVAVGAVRVRVEVAHAGEHVGVDLARDELQPIVRPVGTPAAERREPYRDGDDIVIPVYEERLVVERRLFLKEEVRLRRVRHVEHREGAVPVRREHAVVERQQPDGSWRELPVGAGAPVAEPIPSATGQEALE